MPSINIEDIDEYLLDKKNITKTKRFLSSDLLSRSLGAIGIIYGDIGTSPIYTFSSIFSNLFSEKRLPNHDDILGATSNIIWLLILVVLVKYCFFALRADFNGEGGTFAMYEKLVGHRESYSKCSYIFLSILACLAASLLFGDATITPAISVISALEGIKLVAPSFSSVYIVSIGVTLIILLFGFQYKGTATVGFYFAPIICLWFLSISSIGIYCLSVYDIGILAAFNPYQAIKWWFKGNFAGSVAFNTYGNVLLCVTGAEALFADLGHFGRDAVYVSWMSIAFPALLLQYLGQGSYLLYITNLLNQPSLDSKDYNDLISTLSTSVFWASLPKYSSLFYYLMIILATLATIVASQAVISGAFTLMSQASSLGFVPKLNVIHTNSKHKGQVYIGSIAFLQCTVCIFMIIAYQSSADLAAAYGAAVTSVFLITTIYLTLYIAPICWNYTPLAYGSMAILFGFIDSIMWTSTLQKVAKGAWLPLFIGAIFSCIMGIWTLYSQWVKDAIKNMINRSNASVFSSLKTRENKEELTIDSFHQSNLTFKYPITRGKGIGIFLSPHRACIPLSFSRLCSRVQRLPQFILFVTVECSLLPFVSFEDRIEMKLIEEKEEGSIYSFVIHYGWSQSSCTSTMNVLESLREFFHHQSSLNLLLKERFLKMKYNKTKTKVSIENFKDESLSIFITNYILKPSSERHFFGKFVINFSLLLKACLSPTAIQYFGLPSDNTTLIGVDIPV